MTPKRARLAEMRHREPEVLNKFAFLIKQKRLKYKIKQQYLADHLGIKRPALAMIETMRARPGFMTTLMIMKKLKIELRDLI